MLNIVVKQLLLYNRSIRAWYSCTAVDLIGVISSNAEHKLGEDTSGECSQYRHYKSRQYVYTNTNSEKTHQVNVLNIGITSHVSMCIP